MHHKEHLVYKIVIDLLGSYLKQFDSPDSRIYHDEYLPLAIDFYKKIKDEDLDEIHKELS